MISRSANNEYHYLFSTKWWVSKTHARQWRTRSSTHLVRWWQISMAHFVSGIVRWCRYEHPCWNAWRTYSWRWYDQFRSSFARWMAGLIDASELPTQWLSTDLHPIEYGNSPSVRSPQQGGSGYQLRNYASVAPPPSCVDVGSRCLDEFRPSSPTYHRRSSHWAHHRDCPATINRNLSCW